MTPRLFPECRAKETQSESPVIVTEEKPNYSFLKFESSVGTTMTFHFTDKGHGKNAKQFSWFLLLKPQCAALWVASLAAVLWTMLNAIKNQLVFRSSVTRGKPCKEKFLFKFISGYLVLSFMLLAFEIVAYWNGWYLQEPSLHLLETTEIQTSIHSVYLSWLFFRSNYIAYPVQAVSNLCVILFVIQSIDRILLCLGWLWIKFRDIKPRIEGNSFKDDGDLEYEYPMVLVQIPMCNEREVYEQSISAVCQIDWPKDHLLIQVLDDSDDETLMLLIEAEVSKWSKRGVNIVYHHRSVRTGYKAGNLKSAMSCDYVKNYEFVAIFDADFQPSTDFLKQTIPHFKGNPDLGLVQARWRFVNKDENLITRLQNINMCFHFEVEQQVNGVFLNFFGFNGTAGVWRIKALEDSGGWLDRTTVEDMDIAVRAHLNGWKFIFLNDVKVLCEVPESYEAYRKQQHRWHSGPMNLFRFCLSDVITSKISIWKKANLILLFFLLRKLILPFYSFTLLCVILPLTMFIPEAQLPAWLICYVPICMSFLNVLPSSRSFPFTIPYLLFENTMSVIKFNAMLTGLLQMGSSYEWVVTKKAGRSSEANLLAATATNLKDSNHTELQRRASESTQLELHNLKKDDGEAKNPTHVRKGKRTYKKELAFGLLFLTAAGRSFLSGWGIHFCVLLFQGTSFLLAGLGLIGE